MRVALVHDYLTQLGGAERVLDSLIALYPDAPVFTLLYDERGTQGRYRNSDIRPSSLQRLPGTKRYHRLFPPLMPQAIEAFDLRAYDLVISSASSFAKGVITHPGTVHVSFVHTPLRYAWDDSQRYVKEFHAFPKLLKYAARPALTYLRLWDREAAQRPDILVANSAHVQRRIRKYYGRDAHVVYPPVRTAAFSGITRAPGAAYLMWGRLMAYKRFDLGIQAANMLGLPLRIIGQGPELRQLQRMAGPTVTFLGAANDAVLREELATARAVLFPQEEDFGIVAVEALAAGVPLIAYRNGGAAEIVRDGEDGIFIEQQTADALADAMRNFSPDAFAPQRLRQRAAAFDEPVFQQRLQTIITDALSAQ
jgi:glycosyltransferase involved in cell wall biosynthesis